MMMRNQSGHSNPLLVGRELAPQHKEYLEERAVPLELARKAGLVSVSRKEAETLLGFPYPSKAGGLWIPYPGPDDFGRLRLDEPFPGKDKKKKPVRYLTPKEEVRPYLPLAVDDSIWKDTTKPLCIVESPIKALSLTAAGWPSIGVAGVWTGHEKGAPVNRLPGWFLEQVKLPGRRVVLLYDAGRATNKSVLQAEKKQAERYASAGAEVFVASLPLTVEGGDQGPDDFLAKHGAEVLRRVIETAKPLAEAYASEESAPKKTQAQLIVELAQEAKMQLWCDAMGLVWCTFETGNHVEHHRLRSEPARRYLRQLTQQVGILPGAQSLQDAIATLEALTPREESHPVFVRVGEHQEKLYLDLGSPDWSAIEIDAEGWRWVKVPPVRFRRSKGMMPLPQPQKGGTVEELRPLLNTPGEEEWRFIVAWLLASLRAKGPYPILTIQGEQGSAKSTNARMVRALIDPNACPLRSTPRNEQDLAIAATNGWVISYDNLSGVSDWLSDALCRAATGGGFATRALYSDDEETLLDFQRPVLLNGIDEVATRGDLADRALLVRLPRIKEELRREEREVWSEFNEALPKILGAFLDVVSAGLKKLPSVKLKRLPRMADFARWIAACEEALGWEEGSFLEMYAVARDQMAETAIEGDLFAGAVVALVKEKGVWSGTASELLAVLNARVDEALRRVKGWPQDATRTSNKLRRVAPSLRRVGVEVDLDSREGKKGTRNLRLSGADAADARAPAFGLGINEQKKEESKEQGLFRTDTQNSVSTVSSVSPLAIRGLADARPTLADASPLAASAEKPVPLKVADAADAADAEKRTSSIQAPEVRSDLNDQPVPDGTWPEDREVWDAY